MANDIERGDSDKAAHLLNHTMWIGAWDEFEANCIKRWRESSLVNDREEQWLRLQVGRDVRAYIERIFRRGLVE